MVTESSGGTRDAPPRVVFVGGTPRGLRVARLLVERGVHLSGVVVLQEDAHEDSSARHGLIDLAEATGAPSITTRRISAAHTADLVHVWAPDLLISVGWRTMIPAEVTAFPSLGCVGVHDSPLPRYRGFAPTNWAVLNGEKTWGVTLFHLADGVDEGDVVGQEVFDVPERVTAPELYDLVIEATVRVVDRNLGPLLAGAAPRTAQDDSRATYACARTPEDGRIDWSRGTVEIDRLVRALTHPYPGASTTWMGEPMAVLEAVPLDPAPVYEGRIPGRIVRFDEHSADVLTGDGVLRITAVWTPDAGRRPAGAVLRSVRRSLGV